MPKSFGKLLLTSVLLLFMLASVANAGFLEKRTRIELKGGIWDQKTDVAYTVSGGTVETNYGGEGAMGGIAVSHWVRENLALAISVNGLGVSVDNRVAAGSVYSHTVTVAPILFGARYYFPNSTFGSSWRPYITASVGPVIGYESIEEVTSSAVTHNETTETTFGGHIGAGLDLQLSRLFMLGFSGGYFAHSDFDRPIGDKKNFNGPEFGISFSILLGKGAN